MHPPLVAPVLRIIVAITCGKEVAPCFARRKWKFSTGNHSQNRRVFFSLVSLPDAAMHEFWFANSDFALVLETDLKDHDAVILRINEWEQTVKQNNNFASVYAGLTGHVQ